MYHIFDIPIYRLSPENRLIEEDKEKEKLFDSFSKADKIYWIKENTDKYYNERYQKCRKYNDIIGYISIEVSGGGKMFGDYFLIDVKHVTKNGKKVFKYMGKFFEIWFLKHENSDEMLKRLILTLTECQKNGYRTKNRYIDIDALKNIRSYVDWKTLLF